MCVYMFPTKIQVYDFNSVTENSSGDFGTHLILKKWFYFLKLLDFSIFKLS